MCIDCWRIATEHSIGAILGQLHDWHEWHEWHEWHDGVTERGATAVCRATVITRNRGPLSMRRWSMSRNWRVAVAIHIKSRITSEVCDPGHPPV